jgi:DMSO/TMAO reductase YedYZ molybdopterin-dependent catalytic subunit
MATDANEPAATDPDTPATAPAKGAPIGRRIVLGALGLGALGILVGARVQSLTSRLLLPITLRDPTGLSDLLPAAGRFRIYSVTGSLPRRTDAAYRLTVAGLVDQPTTLTLDDVRQRLPQVALTRDFQCVTGWRVEDVLWAGVRLRDVLAAAGLQQAATGVVFKSFDGTYSETLTMDQAQRDDVLVAHTLLGQPLSREHGGPVRLYVAPMYGYKSLKWLDRIEVVNAVPDDAGYWEQRGYDRDAWVGHSNGGAEAPT